MFRFRALTTFVVVVILMFGWMPTSVAESRGTDHGVLVLMYHHFDEQENALKVSAARFDEQMRYLHRHGYTAIGIDDLLAYLRGECPLPERAVLITMDDGYASNYEIAYPILKEYDLKAVVFPVVRWADEPAPYTPHFNWDEARAMVASGVMEIHSHTYDLHYYPEGSSVPALEAVDEDVAMIDLMKSRLRIIDEIGTPAQAFAYPYGWNTDRSVRLLQEAGFDIAFTVKPGRVFRGMDPYRLPRVNVPGGISIEEFAQLLQTQ